jgi:outer membrane protein TolC
MIIFKGISLAIALAGGPMSLDEALAIAKHNSFTLRSAESTIRANQQKVREAKGAIGPQITTNFQHLRYGNQQSGTIGGQPIQFVPFDQNTWSNQLQMQLDIIGVWKKNEKGAKAGVKSSQDTLIAAENDLRQNVRKAYLQVLRAKNLVDVAVQGRKNIEARVEQSQKQFRAGEIAKIDYDRLKAQKASADSDVLTAQNGLTVAKQILNLALSRPIETEFDVTSYAKPVEVKADVATLVTYGQNARPEINSLSNTLLALDAVKVVSGAGAMPSLNLSVNNSQTLDPAGFNPQREVNTTVLALAVPVFDSGIARAKRKQTEEQIVQTQNSLGQLKLSISQEVRAALANMENATARKAAATEQLSLAQEVVRIARVRRDAGEGIVLEIIDAETQWVNAQNTMINAEFDYLTAYADLQRAVGADNIDAALQAWEEQKQKATTKKRGRK